MREYKIFNTLIKSQPSAQFIFNSISFLAGICAVVKLVWILEAAKIITLTGNIAKKHFKIKGIMQKTMVCREKKLKSEKGR